MSSKRRINKNALFPEHKKKLTNRIYKVTVVHKVSLGHVDRHLKVRRFYYTLLLSKEWSLRPDVIELVLWPQPDRISAKLTDLSRETFLKTTCLGLMLTMLRLQQRNVIYRSDISVITSMPPEITWLMLDIDLV